MIRRPYDLQQEAPEPAEPMDPRVAARLADVAAERRAAEVQARRRRALVGLVVFAAVALLAGLSLSPLLGVHEVRVEGAVQTAPAEVVAATRLRPSDALVRLDARRISRRVEQLPWVEAASMEREWPQTVRIRVKERTPAALAPCTEGMCLVDRTGRVLAPAGPTAPAVPEGGPAATGTLPTISEVPLAGAPGTSLPSAARPALEVAVALPEALRPLVLAIRSDGELVEVALRVPGRERTPPVVRLGDVSRLPDKLTAAATVLTKQGPGGVAGIEVLDVRVPEAPALTRSRTGP